LAPPSLTSLLPAPGEPPLASDAVLDRFVSWVAQSGLSLYPAQEEAILELLEGKHLVLATPTGSGKSLVATALHFKAMAEGKTSFYTCPIKALVNEKFFALCNAFGPENVGMMTGDAAINRKAPIICCTAEILSNLSLRDPTLFADYVVMDEFHYYADPERGVAWQIPLLATPDSTFLLMSATLGDLTTIVTSLETLSGKKVAEVRSAERPVPLDFEYVETPLHETVEKLLDGGKAPIYLVNFSQRAAAEQAQNLTSVNFSTKEEKEQIRLALQDARFDTPFGKEMSKLLRHGIGLHHAGLLPKYRLLVEKLAQSGLLKVISGTDTLGVGVNIPIRTVLFTQLCKFDGQKVGILSVRDFLQISGRAGRKGFDDRGSVVVQAPEHAIENLKLQAKKQGGKKVVMRQPPQKGYVHWDRQTFDRLLSKPPEPLESRFTVTHSFLLNLLQSGYESRGGGYRRLIDLISKSHDRDYVKGQHRKRAATLLRSLLTAGIVIHHKGKPAYLELAPGLQHDFSLNHTLSLWLLETLPKIDRESETYALDVLTLVESILESPQVVLWAQLDKLKGEKVAELKARGVEYDERMAELDKLEHPKPNADFIYFTFNAFSAKHPWIGEENIRPKSIAREMFEQCAGFGEYVVDYGLQRSEGVLLRYLSDCYKTLAQTVPEALRTEVMEDVLTYLRTLLRQTDSSLLDEWERMRDPEAAEAAITARLAQSQQPPKPRDLAAHPKAFAARIRTDLHRLLRALARKDYEGALAALMPGTEWTAVSLAKELEPYWAEHPAIDVTPAARKPDKTQLSPDGARVWIARQNIVDPTGEADWMIDCVVDLTEARDEDAPLIQLRRIGT
jgi:superfamily II RNA helicase